MFVAFAVFLNASMHSFPYLTSPVYHEMSKAISALASSIWPSFGSTSTFKFQPEILVHALFCHVHREKSKLPRITMAVPGIISTFNLVSKQVSHPIVSSILFSLYSWMIEKNRLKIHFLPTQRPWWSVCGLHSIRSTLGEHSKFH